MLTAINKMYTMITAVNNFYTLLELHRHQLKVNNVYTDMLTAINKIHTMI